MSFTIEIKYAKNDLYPKTLKHQSKSINSLQEKSYIAHGTEKPPLGHLDGNSHNLKFPALQREGIQ